MYTIEYTTNMSKTKSHTQQEVEHNHEENMKNSNKKIPGNVLFHRRYSSADFRKFEQEVWNYYKKNKRDLPWRHTTDPYHILVSEVMLQQTQVSRVISKYQEFLKKFPNITSLAQATKPEVLTLWQGLGYNRRALFLKKTCETLLEQSLQKSSNARQTSRLHKPQFPTSREELVKLPGIGQSTAGAILNFSFNTPTAFIETNIRAVFIYHFFKETSSVSDIHIHELIEETLKHKKQKVNPREWFYALYDYGSMLKATLGKKKTALHKQSKHYNKQTSFKGSNREIRSSILKLFIEVKDSKARTDLHKGISETYIISSMLNRLPQATPENVKRNISALAHEGFIELTNESSDLSTYILSVV
jgi:A/G-specific adenine glycosylase